MVQWDSTPTPKSAALIITPQEEALLSLCKQILKSHIFRGNYLERRYVEAVSGYRDIVALQSSERDLKKLLLDISQKLHMFYQHTPHRKVWIGITHEQLVGAYTQAVANDTYIWTEFEDMAFGPYWFIIKSVRFRESEIVLKLKMLRPVEPGSPEKTNQHLLRSAIGTTTPAPAHDTTQAGTDAGVSYRENLGPEIGLQDFVETVQQWGTSIKLTAYEFMSNDISKENIKSFLQFLVLMVIGLVSGSVAAIKFLGVFTLRFMCELSRLIHVLTPVLLKLIDVLTKMVGGFYILLAMIWRDTVGNRGEAKKQNTMQAVEYNRPIYKSIKYNVSQSYQQEYGHGEHENKYE